MNKQLYVWMMILSCLSTGFAQTKPISIRRTQNKETIEFKNVDGKVVRTIDVEAENPYRKNYVPQNQNARGEKAAYSSIGEIVSEESNTLVAVSYSYKAFSKDSQQLQDVGESTLIVYDKSGAEVFKKRIEADNALQPLISQDGRYVAVPFGGLVHDDDTRRVGFSIYDLSSNSLLHDLSTSYLNGSWTSGEVFVFSASGVNRSETYYVFNTDTGVLFMKKYDFDTLRLIKKFINEGVVFFLPPDGERVEPYETHFEVVKPTTK